MLPLHQLGYPKPTDGANFGGHSNGTNAIAGVRAGAKSESTNESSDQVLFRPRGPTHGTDIMYEQENHPADLTARGW